MADDVADLRNFYARPLGQMVRRLLVAKLRARWPSVAGMRVLGLGYAIPFLGVFRDEAERTFAFMPAAQGVIEWPPGGPSGVSLVDADMWPLADAMVDRVLVVHGLETSHNADEVLREAWRTLGPGGRLMVVAPSRRGLWARMDTTPFGHGRPFSRSQLARLFDETSFEAESWGEALFFPPVERGIVLRSAVAFERFGTRFSLPFAGVHVVEAVKGQHRPAVVHAVRKLEPRRAPVLAPGAAPAPSP